jgi:predicted MFS family arabinose efflux permease
MDHVRPDQVGISIPLVVVCGLGFGMQPIVTQSWLFSAAPNHHEGAQALFVSSAQVSIGNGALVGGLLPDHLGIDSALILAAVTVGLSAIMFARQPAA